MNQTAHDQTPPANMHTLVSMLAVQTIHALGKAPGPDGAYPEPNLNLAKLLADLLGVIEEKTKGNLTAEEQSTVSTMAHNARMAYLAVKNLQAG